MLGAAPTARLGRVQVTTPPEWPQDQPFPDAEPTVAELWIVPPSDGAVTAIVIAGADPTARASRVQVTTPPERPQLQPDPSADTNVTPAGSVSVTVTEAAAAGPAFFTTRRYVRSPPVSTGSGSSVPEIDRSASSGATALTL